MKKRYSMKFLLSLLMIFSMASLMKITVNAKAITTPTKELSKITNFDTYTVTVNGPKNTKISYNVFAQCPSTLKGTAKKKDYIAGHGCAACALTSVLSGHSKKYANLTPNKTYKVLEKRVFGTRTWNRNYKRGISNQMPVSLNGISKVLRYAGIKNKYVRYFRNASATKAIENHLKKGKPVIIEVNNHTQKNGHYSRSYNQKWATMKHTLLLVGMTDTGKAIIADSAYRKWSKKMQRVKFAKVSELVKFMIPCTSSSSSYYYDAYYNSGGYILVK